MSLAPEETRKELDTHKAVSDVLKEFNRATNIYGAFFSAHEGYAILLEEVDELWDEVKKKRSVGNYQRMVDEAVQVAAMALRFIVDMSRLKDSEKEKNKFYTN